MHILFWFLYKTATNFGSFQKTNVTSTSPV